MSLNRRGVQMVISQLSLKIPYNSEYYSLQLLTITLFSDIIYLTLKTSKKGGGENEG